MLRTYLIQNLPDPHGPEPVPSGPIPSSRPTGYSPAAIELMGFKKGIKREIAAYPSLKDERYFDGFKRSLLIVAKTDRIPSTTPGAEPPRDARDSGSARSHSTNLETSSSDRPEWSPTRSSTRYQDQISVKCTRQKLRMPSFTRAAHAQPSLSNFPRRDSNFGERTRSRGTTLGERNFPTSPQNEITKLTHCSIYVPMRTISTLQTK